MKRLKFQGRGLLVTCLLLGFEIANQAKPIIALQPKSHIARRGATVEFSVTVEPILPASYQWLLSGVRLPSATNAVLQLTDIQPEQGGEYSVQITDQDGFVQSEAATLTVCWHAQLLSIEKYPDPVPPGYEAKLKLAPDGSFIEIRSADPNKLLPGSVCIKFNAVGTQLWAVTFQETNLPAVFVKDVSFDRQSAVYVAATAPDASEQSTQLLTVKLDPDGQKTWIARHHTTNDVGGISLDTSGNVIVAGSIDGRTADDLTAPVVQSEFALTKFDPGGHLLWCTESPGALSPRIVASAVACDSAGNIWLAQGFGKDLLTAKFSPNGTEVWRAKYSQYWHGLVNPTSIILDGEGAGLVTQHYYDGAPGVRHVTVKYSAVGGQLWQSGYWGAGAGALDSSGNFFFASAHDTGDSLSSFLFKYDGDGNRLWMIGDQALVPHQFRPAAVQIDEAQSIVIHGLYIGTSNDYGRMAIRFRQNATLGLPVIHQEPWTTQRFADGQSTVMKVAATGREPLFYQWKFNGTALPAATNATLLFNNLQTNDTGTYFLLVTNSVGCALSSDIDLTVVKVAPFFVRPPLPQTSPVDQGGGVHLTNHYWLVRYQGEQDRKYSLEVSTNLTNWHESSDGGAFLWSSDGVGFWTGPKQLFFRVRTSP